MQTVNHITYGEKFFGRLKSRALNNTQRTLWDSLLPSLRLNPDVLSEATAEYSAVYLEIGFGSGEHISQLAQQNPNALYIGCEPFINGIASLLEKIHHNNIQNIRIFDDDARKLLPNIPANSIEEVFLMFPDPWPKRRHIERRFVNPGHVEKIHKILKNKGIWKIATDHEVYAKHILKTFQQFPNLFTKIAEFSNKNRPSELEWPKTKYELKSKTDLKLYIIYQKCI